MHEAIGISVSESEAQIAHLAKRQGKIAILSLKSEFLQVPLRRPEQKDMDMSPKENVENLFAGDQYRFFEDSAIRDHARERKEKKPEKEENSRDKFYSLLYNFPVAKSKLSINLDPSIVTYFYFRNDYGLKGERLRKWVKQSIEDRQKRKIEDDHYDYVQYEDDRITAFIYDSVPPLLESLEDLRAFRGDKLIFATMDTNEISLVNLVRNNYHFTDTEISAVVYLENRFSRVIFMRGKSLLHCSVIINEGVQSANILEIIYSKILYEQDQNDIPELSNLILTGKCARLNAHAFFHAKFPNVRVEYISSPKIDDYFTSDKRNEQFSEFAIPISLAWKALESNNPNILKSNLLPNNIKDRQKVLKLAFHGYILLAIIAVSAFVLAWKINANKNEIQSIHRKNFIMQEELQRMQPKIDKVHELQVNVATMQTNMRIIDSLGTGHDKIMNFLNDLNGQVKNTGNLWLVELKNIAPGFYMKGYSLNSDRISQLSYNLGNVNLNTVKHTKLGDKKVFEFECEKKFATLSDNAIFGDLKVPQELHKTVLNNNTISFENVPQATNFADNQLKETTQTKSKFEQASNTNLTNNLKSGNDFTQHDNTEAPVSSAPEPKTFAPEPATSKANDIAEPMANNDSEPAAIKTETFSGDYTLFVSTHATIVSAKQEIKKLKSRGLEADIQHQYSSLNKMTMYRIYVGRFPSNEDAAQWAQQHVSDIGRNYSIVNLSEANGANYASNNTAQDDSNGSEQGTNEHTNTLPKTAMKDVASKPEVLSENIDKDKLMSNADFSEPTPTSSSATAEHEAKSDDTPGNTDYTSLESTTGDYTIFVASHISSVSANQDVIRLKSKGYDAQIHKEYSSADGMTWYHVYIGRFTTREQAMEKAQQLVEIIGKKYRVKNMQGTF